MSTYTITFFQRFSQLYDAYLEHYHKTLESSLCATEKVSHIEQITAGIAHEIRNPLALIKANLQFMQLSDTHTAYTKNYTMIYRELDRVDDLISEFLEFTKPQDFTLTCLPLHPLLLETLQLFMVNASAQHIQIQTTLCASAPHILGNRNRLEQVFINIFKNAIEAMDAQGTLTLSTSIDHQSVLICIRDTGIGIPSDLLCQTGSPFFTTKKNGTGLGLSICHKIIAHHHGILSIYNNPDKGSSRHR